METKNSMTEDQLEETLESVFKAILLKYVLLDLVKPEDDPELIVECPTIKISKFGIIGVPFVWSGTGENKRRIHINYRYMRQYGLTKSELIYHAKNNTLEYLNTNLSCDGSTGKELLDETLKQNKEE